MEMLRVKAGGDNKISNKYRSYEVVVIESTLHFIFFYKILYSSHTLSILYISSAPFPSFSNYLILLKFRNLYSISKLQCLRIVSKAFVIVRPTMLHRIMDGTARVLFVLGGPGCGKGTQCSNLVTRQGFLHLSAGELLRNEIARGSSNGELIQKLINEGKIVPAEITTNLLREEMVRRGWNKRFLIDGFPRNQDNYDTWGRVCPDVDIDGVLFIDVSEEVMLQRICGRSEGRSDDNPEVFRKRYHTYTSETKPIIDLFTTMDKVFRVDGSSSPEAVYLQVCHALSLSAN